MEQLTIPVRITDPDISFSALIRRPEWRAAVNMAREALQRRGVVKGFIDLPQPVGVHRYWTVRRDGAMFRCIIQYAMSPLDAFGEAGWRGRVDVAWET